MMTPSTHVLAAICMPHHLACILEAMHWTFKQLGAGAPAWGNNMSHQTGIDAMVSGPTKLACRMMRVNARRLPVSSGPKAISSWNGCGLRAPPLACGNSLPWGRCGGFGSNKIIGVARRGLKRCAGSRTTSNHSQRCSRSRLSTRIARRVYRRCPIWSGGSVAQGRQPCLLVHRPGAGDPYTLRR
jgi:hypothetical protein